MTNTILASLAPSGELCATINVGNPILASRDSSSAGARGVSVDIANELATRLGVAAKLLVVDAAAKAVEAVTGGQVDVGFFAVDPVRGAGIAFTAPYVLIEGCFLVRQSAPITEYSQVDTPGTRVAVGAGSAYDLFLTRELKRASVFRVPTSPAVTAAFLEHGLEVAAGIRQQLQADALRHGGLRLIEKPFMVIQQAMGVARGRGEAAAAYLRGFVDDLRSSGYIREALARHGIEGATVA
ncbi:MAG TPA: transporter substrate-binding domain-containing protein [Steroidobacteraceae bacterium]|jgi:polar amino acid transport system substrate-binding protein|nr:transporter substrate-binding domain-containing protein [Steroidobacteraceae bacterium]